MATFTLQVPTINDNPYDFDTLFGLWSKVNGDGLDVTFDFSRCGFLRQNAVAFLGGLARLVQDRGGIVRFDWNSLRTDVASNLAKNNFRDSFGNLTPASVGNAIPYREDRESDKASLINYLKFCWLGRGWVSVSNGLRDAIVGRVWEIYENALEHGESPIGLFSCGQHYPRQHLLKLTVLDFGVGIPSNVRLFFQDLKLSPAKALRWAFKKGTTTKPNGTGRGLGLDLLKQFVRLNKGRLEVFSHEGYAVMDEGGERYEARPTFFEGTLLNLSLNCDESYYCLASETQDRPLF